MSITVEKIRSLNILMHRLLQTHLETVELGKWYLYKSDTIDINIEDPENKHNENRVYILKELKEQFELYEEQGDILDNLNINSGSIIHYRKFYYYSVGLKCIESYINTNHNLESGLLVVMLLMNLTQEQNLYNNKEDKSLELLLIAYRQLGISRKETNSLIDLSDIIIQKISKANYAKMIKGKKTKRK